jgi:hypothetical protein
MVLISGRKLGWVRDCLEKDCLEKDCLERDSGN